MIMNYLGAVDLECHETKKDSSQKLVTGSGSPRFASPLIIQFIQTSEGVFPLYMFVKAIYKGKEIDCNCKNREEFIKRIKFKGGIR